MSQAHYSEKELEYMCNQDFLLTKNVVIQKTFQLLTMVQTRLQSDFERQAVPSWFNKRLVKGSSIRAYHTLCLITPVFLSMMMFLLFALCFGGVIISAPHCTLVVNTWSYIGNSWSTTAIL